MSIYYLIALLAALAWAISSLISADITREVGSIAFNRLRLLLVSIILISYTTYIDTWSTIDQSFLLLILFSGIIGIFLGDTLLFMALQKIGPRRNNILFSLAAPFTVILNIIFLNHLMNTISLIGCFVVFLGVVVAIIYGTEKDNQHRWEVIEGSLYIGVIMGIFAALCQAIGLIIMKPILDSGADPIASAALRTSASFILISFTFFIKSSAFKSKEKINIKIIS